MKFRLSTFFFTLFLLMGLITAVLIVREYGLSKILYFYKDFDALLVIGYLVSTLVIYIILTWRWHTILKSMNHNVHFGKLFVYKIIGNSINYFTVGPRVGGEATQAALLQNHGIKTAKGFSTIIIDKMIETTTSGILFIVGLFLVSLRYVIPEHTGLFLILSGAIFIVIVGLFYYRMLNDKHFFLHIYRFFRLHKSKNKTVKEVGKNIREMEVIMFKFYKQDHKTFFVATIIGLISWVVMFIEYWLLAMLLGMNLGFVALFFIIAFIGLSLLFPVPMAVGALEAGQVGAFSIIRISGTAGLALAFLVRIKDIIWGIIGMIFLAIYGFRIKPNTANDTAGKRKK